MSQRPSIKISPFALTKPNTFSRARLNSLVHSNFANTQQDGSWQFDRKRADLPICAHAGVLVFSNEVQWASAPRILAWIQYQYVESQEQLGVDPSIEPVDEVPPSLYLSCGEFIRGFFEIDSGIVFDKQGVSIGLLSITSAKLSELAESLSANFELEMILVRDVYEGEAYFANSLIDI